MNPIQSIEEAMSIRAALDHAGLRYKGYDPQIMDSIKATVDDLLIMIEDNNSIEEINDRLLRMQDDIDYILVYGFEEMMKISTVDDLLIMIEDNNSIEEINDRLLRMQDDIDDILVYVFEEMMKISIF